MSLRQEIETWCAALARYDANEFDDAIQCFEQIPDTSKILFNIGVIHATLGEHAKAVDCYQRAVQLDQYLAVSYFQQGVSNFLIGDFEEALANFNDTLLYLRGNSNIDYEQLGLKFKLFCCEVLFNRGLCYIYLQQKKAGMQDLMFAAKEKAVPDHDVIDEAIREEADGYTVFSIPVGIIYRPNEAKIKNLKTRDFLGKARLVAAQDQHSYSDARQNAALAARTYDDRLDDKLSYAALHLVRPGLSSRSRQQSEPPMHRNVFPPTPPPELERSEHTHGRRKSSESGHSANPSFQQSRPLANKPSRLDLGTAAFAQPKERPRLGAERTMPAALAQSKDRPRLGTVRSASERPQMRSEYFISSPRSHDRHSGRRSQREQHPTTVVEEDPIEAYSAQATAERSQQQLLLSPYGHQQSKSSHHRQQQQHRPVSIQEEEAGEDGYSSPSDSPLAFEIIPPKQSNHGRQPSRTHRQPSLRKLRVKVHAEGDTRYVMTTPDVQFSELLDQTRLKLGLRGSFKLKIKDEEGDMVTMGDQDDLDMAVSACKAAAAKEQVDMGKIDVWVQEM